MRRNSPFFILANPRSGSSLLRIICDSHMNITVPPECGFMEWWYEKYQDWAVGDSSNIVKLDSFINDLQNSKKIETWELDIELVRKEIQVKLPTSYAELVALVYKCYGKKRKNNILVWGDKNNYYINKLSKLYKIYPNAKFIHLVRDGRDVAVSYIALKNIKTKSKYVPKLSSDIKVIAEEWSNNNKQILSFLDKLPVTQVLTVQYEDLIMNLENECVRICTFLKIPFDESMLNYFQQNQLYQLEPKETIDWKERTKEKPDSTRIGQYKEKLNDQEIRDFEKVALKELDNYGYR